MLVRIAIIAAAAALVAGCRDGATGGAAPAVAPQPPTEACICARACGVPVVGDGYRIGVRGAPVALGYCPPLHDEIIYENMARCGCGRPVRPGNPRRSPNH